MNYRMILLSLSIFFSGCSMLVTRSGMEDIPGWGSPLPATQCWIGITYMSTMLAYEEAPVLIPVVVAGNVVDLGTAAATDIVLLPLDIIIPENEDISSDCFPSFH